MDILQDLIFPVIVAVTGAAIIALARWIASKNQTPRDLMSAYPHLAHTLSTIGISIIVSVVVLRLFTVWDNPLLGISLISGGTVENGQKGNHFGPVDFSLINSTAPVGGYEIQFTHPAKAIPFIIVGPTRSLETPLIVKRVHADGFSVYSGEATGKIDTNFWFLAIAPR
jgi:hypothetical protein